MKTETRLEFNKNLYTLKSVKSASRAYRDFVNFKITDHEKHIDVAIRFAGKTEDAEKIIDEFKNYVLCADIQHELN
ncbi:MAG: HxsD-like protein [Candidatus Omnitrophica bacterium]|nr:HxsD-like protein [Candidatus Omnitrophota bacterium]